MISMLRAITLCALTGVLLACGTSGGGGDAGVDDDGGGRGDASASEGLVFEFVADPALGDELRTATIACSFAFLATLPWDQIALEEGEYRIEPGSPHMPAVVAGLSAAFSLADVR